MRAISCFPWIASLVLAPFATPAHAALVDVTVTARNLAAAQQHLVRAAALRLQ